MPISTRHIRTATIQTLAAMLLTGAISVARSAQSSSIPAYLDPLQPVSVGVGDLVSKMTPEKKTSQLVNQARAIPRPKAVFRDHPSARLLPSKLLCP